jgi:hypothetical protein
MTTTSKFQKKPDYFSSKEDCIKSNRVKIMSNPRYKEFKQTHFTAGDNDQFQEYRDSTNGDVCIKSIKLENNVFESFDFTDKVEWAKYQNLNATCVNNTFNYMFNKFKKGIFVKIQNNKLRVFLPFSKKGYVNEWGQNIKIDPKFGTMYNFVTHINKMLGKRYKVSVDAFPDNWYANNCLIRSEYPIAEGDTNTPNMSDMLKTLCEKRKVPDIEFFINRRDFPLIKRNSTEAYDHMFGNDHPLVSHEYDQYAPILSMVTSDKFADIPIPTGDDWARIGVKTGKFFGKDCKLYPTIDSFTIKWNDKKPTAVFRGASTGCGVTIDTNIRLKLAYISATTPPDKDGMLLDAGISKWQLRPRKLKGETYLQTIDVPSMNKSGIHIASFLSPLQQSGYKYIINVDGHVSAFRLSLEMSMGCCILLADSKYRLWFRSLMKPMVEYVPVKADLSDLIDQIKWCRDHDKECKKIAKNAMKFYLKYLQSDGALDYLQKIIIDLKNQSGVYLYNYETPLKRQIRLEKDFDLSYPLTNKTISDIGSIPRQARSFGILKGMEWIVNMVNKKSEFTKVAKKGDVIFTNNAKTVIVQKYNLAGFSFVIKASTDLLKQQENIHEAYIGTKVINDIVRYIPNFAYVFGKFDGLIENIVIMEHIYGQTFDKWLQSDKFNMQDYIYILIQIALALEVAQSQGGFVHYDLTPWNIIIQESPKPISFDYMIDSKNVFRINTKLIPVIIDYGKSHVIHENQHHGYINMYKMSTIQDVISLLLTSLNVIIQFDLSKKDVDEVIKLSNFMSGTGYRKKPFRPTGKKGVSDVQYFISRAKKYTEMISSNKHELELLTPIDFITYIGKTFKYNFKYEKIDFPVFRINRGNPRQVFEYILSSTKNDKLKSFVDVFERIITCKFPKQINLFFSYYAAQTLEENITSVYKLMIYYIGDQKGDSIINAHKMYGKALRKIKSVYTKKLEVEEDEKIEYDIHHSFDYLEIAPYTEDTFLIPEVIFNLMKKYENNYEDLSEYKNIIEQILLNKGIFSLSDNHREYYVKNFKKLLETNSVNMKTYTANINTLYKTGKDIYFNDKEKLKLEQCQVGEYMSIYNKIEEYKKDSPKKKLDSSHESSSDEDSSDEDSSDEDSPKKKLDSSDGDSPKKKLDSSEDSSDEDSSDEDSSDEDSPKKKLDSSYGDSPKKKLDSSDEDSSDEDSSDEDSSDEDSPKKKFDRRYAITFGEVSILHVGGEERGKMKEKGFSVKELEKIKKKLTKKGVKSDLYMLSDELPENLRDENEAATLVIRNAANYILKSSRGSDNLYSEQNGIQYDTMFYKRRGSVMNNKQARLNIVFGDEGQKQYLSNYDGTQATNKIKIDMDNDVLYSVAPFDNLPYLSGIRDGLSTILGDKAVDLNAEGNYYHKETSGIGYHGDAERKIVIGLSLGKSSTLRYNWRLPRSTAHPFNDINLNVNHGDIYIMSEKATGFDWRSTSKVRIVHAAGHKSYIDKGFQSIEEEKTNKRNKRNVKDLKK